MADAVLPVLSRALTRLAADRQPGRRRLSVAVVFLGYERSRSERALPALWSALEASGHVASLVAVENRPLDLPDLGIPGMVTVAGDNSMHEFSGWERGRPVAAELAGTPDAWLFANDRMLDYGYPFTELLTGEAIEVAAGLRALTGKVDHYPRQVRSLGLDVRRWTRTACFVVRSDLLGELGSLMTVDSERLDALFPAEKPAFDLEADGIDPLHSEFLRAFLLHADSTHDVGRWHTGPLDRSRRSWDLARHKVASILNEQLLSARLRALGGACVPLETANWLGQLGPASARSHRLVEAIESGGEATAFRLRYPAGRVRALLRTARVSAG